MNILNAIRQRRSVRSFKEQSLSPHLLENLNKAVNETYSPFGGTVTIRLKQFGTGGDFKPGTYGVIKGASDYFLVGIADDEISWLSAGFRFEQVVLKAVELGLGTCWIAATFRGTQFESGQTWENGESLKIVSPVGYPAEPRLAERLMRFGVGASKRKPFADLFFKDDFTMPLPEDSKFGEPLAMLRLAPSSTNSQPWRVLVDESRNKVMFYCKSRGNISILDCGIGICHFYETERYNGFDGSFATDENRPEAPDGWKYITTYTRQN